MIHNQIIVALDNEIEEGTWLVEKIENNPEIKDKVYGYKIGSLWILQKGLDAIEELYYGSETDDINIILDMQKWPTDIPDIVKKQVKKVAETGSVKEIIACPMGGGRKSLQAFVDTVKESGMRPLCVLEMTHPESDSYLKLGSWTDILHDAATMEIDGYIIPATKEPREEIKMYLKTDFPKLFYDLYTTGYKVQGGQADPMRKFGVTKFIIGRAIYEAENLDKAIEDAYSEINGLQKISEE